MKPNVGPGRLIAIEGLDGAGTTTQTALLAEWLHGHKGCQVFETREPSRGLAGAVLRSVLARRLAMDGRTLAALFAADRIDHLYRQDGIASRLADGIWVIMDRYYLSSFAYQPLSLERSEIEWLWHLHEPCLVPDMTFFIDVPVEVCIARLQRDRGFHFELYENSQTLQAVRSGYLSSIGYCRQLGHDIQTIDGVRPASEVATAIGERLRPFLKQSCGAASGRRSAPIQPATDAAG